MAATPKAVRAVSDRLALLNVKTVNAKAPDASGNVQLSSADIGAFPAEGGMAGDGGVDTTGMIKEKVYRVYNTGCEPTAADVGAYSKAQADARFLTKSPDINEIRAYALAWYNGNAGYGDTIAGSALSPCTADGRHSGSLPGTWRCMGMTVTINDAHKTTLWQRVA